MASGIDRGYRRTLATAKYCELLEPGRLDQLLEVLHHAFVREIFDRPVGQSAASLVIAQQRIVAHDLREPMAQERTLPLKIQMVQPVDGAHNGRPAAAD